MQPAQTDWPAKLLLVVVVSTTNTRSLQSTFGHSVKIEDKASVRISMLASIADSDASVHRDRTLTQNIGHQLVIDEAVARSSVAESTTHSFPSSRASVMLL